MVIVAQLVRASDCGSEGRGFEPRLSPLKAGQKCPAFLFVWLLELHYIILKKYLKIDISIKL